MRLFGRRDSCRRVKGLLSEYLDGRLSPALKQEVETHLGGCASCRRERETLSSTVSMLRRLPQATPHRSFALRPEVLRPMSRPALAGRLLPAGALVSALLLGVVMWGDFAAGWGSPAPLPQVSAPSVTPSPGPQALQAEGFKAKGVEEVKDHEEGPLATDMPEVMAPATLPAERGFPWWTVEGALGALTLGLALGSVIMLRKGQG